MVFRAAVPLILPRVIGGHTENGRGNLLRRGINARGQPAGHRLSPFPFPVPASSRPQLRG